jgi:L-lactate dehydrogenase complex protein LldG
MQTLRTSKSKEKILSKIRNGLSKAKLEMPFPEVERESMDQIFEKSDLTPEEVFANEFIRLGGKFVFCENEHELLENINALYDNRGWNDLLCSSPRLLEIFHNNKLDFVNAADPKDATAEACITECEALVCRTGSILVSSGEHLGRTAPVFYPVHIIVAYSSQVVDDLQDGINLLKKKYGNNLPSMINLNTGPSRTADIEKTLVVGVHGPGEVFCFYVNA